MSYVFLICGLGSLFLLFVCGGTFEEAERKKIKTAKDGAIFVGVLSAICAATFLFSAGIAWVAP